jgi:hypothetical protein
MSRKTRPSKKSWIICAIKTMSMLRKYLTCLTFPLQSNYRRRIATYERYFKKSDIRKRKKGEVWATIDYKMTKRAQSGRKSEVRLNGKIIPDSTVRKEIPRHVTTYQQWTRFAATGSHPFHPLAALILTQASTKSYDSCWIRNRDTSHFS